MIYKTEHIGAVVGQLGVFYKQMVNKDISPEAWQNVTSYTLAKVTGFSRYHVVNLCEIAVDRKLAVGIIREHRPNVAKVCYRITENGLEFVEYLVDAGIYKSSLDIIRSNHIMQAHCKVDYVGSVMETLMFRDKGKA